jgi:Phage ABA sandwich domain
MDLLLEADRAYLPPGLELDTMIAVHLLGWRVVGYNVDTFPQGATFFGPPDEEGNSFEVTRPGHYSTDIAYAWPLLRHMQKWMVETNLRRGVTALTRVQEYGHWGQADGTTAELAICRSILLALIAEKTGQEVESIILR